MSCSYFPINRAVRLAEGIAGCKIYDGTPNTDEPDEGFRNWRLDFCNEIDSITDNGGGEYQINVTNLAKIDPLNEEKWSFRDKITLYTLDGSTPFGGQTYKQYHVTNDTDSFFTVQDNDIDLSAITDTIYYRLFTPRIGWNFRDTWVEQDYSKDIGLSLFPIVMVKLLRVNPESKSKKTPGYDVKDACFLIAVIDKLENHKYSDIEQEKSELLETRADYFCAYRLNFILNRLPLSAFLPIEPITNFGDRTEIAGMYSIVYLENYDSIFNSRENIN